MKPPIFQEPVIEYWPVDRLLPYAQNARVHTPEQVNQLAASIIEFGFDFPCTVDEHGVLIAGHGRLMAAKQIGLETVPVIPLTHLDQDQVRMLRIADNQITQNSVWDDGLLAPELAWAQGKGIDLDTFGFGDDLVQELVGGLSDDIGDLEEGADPVVNVPDPPPEPVTQPGDLWRLGNHRLLCGDSTNPEHVRRLMRGERAVLFATDPPYMVNYDGTNHPTRNKDWSGSYGITWDDASQGIELYEGFIQSGIDEAITEDAAWYSWHASRRQAMLEAVWEKFGAFVHQQIIWVKDRPVLTRSEFLWKHEPCFFGWIKGKRPPRVAEERLSSTWEIASLFGEERPDHPTPKPLDCFAIPMRQHVSPGGLCYEPFSGSGSQIMAGEATGRRVYAMEISPAYVDVAVERWQAETGDDAFLDGDGKTFSQIEEERHNEGEEEAVA